MKYFYGFLPANAVTYGFLALYLPILGWKLLGALGLVTVVEHIKAFLVLGLTALCLVISLGNSLRLYAIVKR